MMLFAYFEVHVLLHIFAFETWSFKGAITISKDFCSANVHVDVIMKSSMRYMSVYTSTPLFTLSGSSIWYEYHKNYKLFLL